MKYTHVYARVIVCDICVPPPLPHLVLAVPAPVGLLDLARLRVQQDDQGDQALLLLRQLGEGDLAADGVHLLVVLNSDDNNEGNSIRIK